MKNIFAIALLLLPGIGFAQCPGGRCYPQQPPQDYWTPQRPQQPIIPPSKAEMSRNASVMVSAGEYAGSGTVTWYEDGKALIITAKHIFSQSNSQSAGIKWVNGSKATGQIVANDPNGDLTAISVSTAQEIPWVPLARSPVPAGSSVWQCGFPADHGGRWNYRTGKYTGQFPDQVGSEKFEFSVPWTSGDSGGGVFLADTGELLGVVSTRNTDEAGNWIGGTAIGRPEILRFVQSDPCCKCFPKLRAWLNGGKSGTTPPVTPKEMPPADTPAITPPVTPPTTGVTQSQFDELKALIAKIPAGPPGKDGAQGPKGADGAKGADGKPGANGKDGAPGKDADASKLADLQGQIDALRNQHFQAILLDAQGKVTKTTEFGANLPLRIKLLPVTPSQ